MDVKQLELMNWVKLGVLKTETVQPSLSCSWLAPQFRTILGLFIQALFQYDIPTMCSVVPGG